MNKMLTALALVLLLSTGSCTLIPTKAPTPLTLPYPLYEQEYRGNQVTITLRTMADGPASYEFLVTANTAAGQTKFGVYIITVELPEGYQPGTAVDWIERIGDRTGTGGVWEGEGESLGAQALTSSSAFGLGGAADSPVAVFVRIVSADPDDPNTISEQTFGPVAVLQILPDGQGVVRLDP